MSYPSKILQYLRYYQDEEMVSFIYVSWAALMQLELVVNTGSMRFDIWTTGTPLVMALLFYGVKQLALFIRSNLEIEQLRKEGKENEFRP